MLLFCFVDRRWWVVPVTEKWSLKGILGGEEEGSELEFGNFEFGESWCNMVGLFIGV